MYERPAIAGWIGCLVLLIITFSLATYACYDFGNMRSDQTASECEQQMLAPIMRKVARLPADDVLRSKSATIEHLLHGNREDIQPLTARLKRAGWSVEETAFEVGEGLKIVDDPVLFRKTTAARVREICALAAASRSEYESWWINASGIADYVAQNAGLGTVTEGQN